MRRPRYSGKHPRKFTEKYKELNPEKYPETIQKILESGKTPAGTHRSICTKEILEVLKPQPGDLALDATLGYGGHSQEILKYILPSGKLIALDIDPLELPKTEARLRALDIPQDSLKILQMNFSGIRKVLSQEHISGFDLVLADLGLSSMQIDNPKRGFTFKHDGPLDLRMNPERGQPVSALLKILNENELAEILRENADEPKAFQMAKAILKKQKEKPIETTKELANAIRSVSPKDDTPIRRIFQALRIVVNEEFSTLEQFLNDLPFCLRPNARVAILTFHSGEDRRVKHAFKDGLKNNTYSAIADEVIRPTPEEVRSNPRASSAKLRWAIRSKI